jgi:hypothetical protein
VEPSNIGTGDGVINAGVSATSISFRSHHARLNIALEWATLLAIAATKTDRSVVSILATDRRHTDAFTGTG